MPAKLKINFILPFISKTGGILVALEHARHLGALGHDVRSYYPMLPYWRLLHGEKSLLKKILRGQIKPFLINLLRFRKSVPWFHAPLAVTPIPWISGRFLRDADATIATTWPSAHSVAALAPSKGRKYYFIQHYEQWNADPALVDASYRLPLKLLTIAPWLTALMKDRFSREVTAEIHNGIDLEVYRPPARKSWDRFRILMMFHELEIKGTADGLAALAEVHRKFPEAEIVMFGPTPFHARPAHVTFHLNPSLPLLVELYQTSQIFLSPSRSEGWHLPPMEAMACQCALVATRTGCIPTLDDGTNMLVAEPRDSAGLAERIGRLISDAGECERMAMRGYATIRNYTWEIATAKLAEALQP